MPSFFSISFVSNFAICSKRSAPEIRKSSSSELSDMCLDWWFTIISDTPSFMRTTLFDLFSRSAKLVSASFTSSIYCFASGVFSGPFLRFSCMLSSWFWHLISMASFLQITNCFIMFIISASEKTCWLSSCVISFSISAFCSGVSCTSKLSILVPNVSCFFDRLGSVVLISMMPFSIRLSLAWTS